MNTCLLTWLEYFDPLSLRFLPPPPLGPKLAWVEFGRTITVSVSNFTFFLDGSPGIVLAFGLYMSNTVECFEAPTPPLLLSKSPLQHLHLFPSFFSLFSSSPPPPPTPHLSPLVSSLRRCPIAPTSIPISPQESSSLAGYLHCSTRWFMLRSKFDRLAHPSLPLFTSWYYFNIRGLLRPRRRTSRG